MGVFSDLKDIKIIRNLSVGLSAVCVEKAIPGF